MIYIIVYLLLINVYALMAMRRDKQYAIRHKQRIKEKTLLLLAVIGGSTGIWIGMYQFHHKTKKFIFRAGIPLILIVQIYIITALANS